MGVDMGKDKASNTGMGFGGERVRLCGGGKREKKKKGMTVAA